MFETSSFDKIKKRFFKYGKSPPKSTVSFDYMPLFFLDDSLSDSAKILMSLLSCGEAARGRTLEQLRLSFPPAAIDGIAHGISELEKYGYIRSQEYKGEYGEPRVDQRLCICPTTRLPHIEKPLSREAAINHSAKDMFSFACNLGFIAENGKDTTYLLYDALRIFTAVEKALFPNEFVVLPLIGPENYRDKLLDQQMLSVYPHCIIAAIITNCRVIFLQEDCSPDGRKTGMARFITREFSNIRSVSLDEKLGRVVFESFDTDSWDNMHCVDLISLFAVEHFPACYEDALSLLPADSRMPRLSYKHEESF